MTAAQSDQQLCLCVQAACDKVKNTWIRSTISHTQNQKHKYSQQIKLFLYKNNQI